MYERSYGYKYEEVDKYTSAVDIAKKIRADIKQAVDEGLLPSRWKYSVRSDATAISIDVIDCQDAFKPCDGRNCHNVWCSARNDPLYAHAAQTHDVLTDEGEAARMTLKRIHSAYNHDGSELQTDYFDVRYYGGVSFEDADSADFRKRETERLAAKKNARQTGKIVGKVINFGRERTIVHVLVETPEGKHVLGCGARARGTHLSRANDDAQVTCTRCAKRATA